MFAQELARRLRNSLNPSDHRIIVNSVTPGPSVSELFTKSLYKGLGQIAIDLFLRFARKTEDGAISVIWAAVDPKAGFHNAEDNAELNGRYFSNCRECKPSYLAQGETGLMLAEKIWKESIKVIGVGIHDLGVESVVYLDTV